MWICIAIFTISTTVVMIKLILQLRTQKQQYLPLHHNRTLDTSTTSQQISDAPISFLSLPSSQPSPSIMPPFPLPSSTPEKIDTPLPFFRDESPEPSAPPAELEMEPLSSPSPVANRTRSQSKKKKIVFEEISI